MNARPRRRPDTAPTCRVIHLELPGSVLSVRVAFASAYRLELELPINVHLAHHARIEAFTDDEDLVLEPHETSFIIVARRARCAPSRGWTPGT